MSNNSFARCALQNERELGVLPTERWPWLSPKTKMNGFVQREERPLLGGERKLEKVQAWMLKTEHSTCQSVWATDRLRTPRPGSTSV